MSGKYDVDLSGAVWRKSSYSSATKDCVEVAFLDRELVGVRDSKNPDGEALIFTPSQWDGFIRHLSGNR
ncbi:DUF397 domain-containing protein [Nocardia paucivorans]|uniref:DUF397 domain-containing protein n=1 Tax=Nocardia paucivorans TaxID=114259 RepID=UPI000A03F754|nr:DUF397 domain-containing protein [Nocardia paucivorans]